MALYRAPGKERQEENRHVGRNFFPAPRGRDLQLTGVSSSGEASPVTELGLVPARGTFVRHGGTWGLVGKFLTPLHG